MDQEFAFVGSMQRNDLYVVKRSSCFSAGTSF